MKKFKFVSSGFYGSPKDWLDPKYKRLPNPFSMKDIPSGMFSPFMFKKLNSAKKDGLLIKMREGRGYFVGIQVIDKKARDNKKKKDNSDLRSLGKRMKALQKSADVKELLQVVSKIVSLSKNKDIIPEEIKDLVSKVHRWHESVKYK